MGSFTNSNLTDGGTNQDFGQVVTYGRWSLMGSFTNSNLTGGGTNQDFGQVVAYGKFH